MGYKIWRIIDRRRRRSGSSFIHYCAATYWFCFLIISLSFRSLGSSLSLSLSLSANLSLSLSHTHSLSLSLSIAIHSRSCFLLLALSLLLSSSRQFYTFFMSILSADQSHFLLCRLFLKKRYTEVSRTLSLYLYLCRYLFVPCFFYSKSLSLWLSVLIFLARCFCLMGDKWIELNWIELNWIELIWFELNWIEMK